MNTNRLFLKFRSRGSLVCLSRRSYSADNSPNVDEPVLEQIRDLRHHSYPSFIPSIMVSQFLVDYQHVEKNATLQDVPVSVSGRVQQKRVHSSLFFLLIKQDKESVQIKVHSKHTQNYAAAFQDIRKGDIISVTGFPHRTPSGELSVLAEQVQLLAPACHDLPPWNGLKDSSIRYRQRYLDMLVNRDANAVLRKRAEIISTLRNYLDVRGFVEVETPVLSPSAGGAIANPFVTHSKSLKATLSLRIAPELFLKQLVVGGLDRVYEIGRVFRNEGIDKSHNPEFTSCEFYQAYTDYYQLMDMTEDLLRTIVFQTTGKYQVTAINPEDKETEITIDFSQPFKRISVIEAIEEKIGEKLKINESPEVFAEQLDSIFRRLGLQLPSNGPEESTPNPTKNPNPAASPSQLIDELISHFVEPITTQPTFLIDHPILLSPLARKHREKPGMTERFELFVNRMELCNAYTELNNPFEQKERFDMQETENHQLGVFKSEETKEAESEYVRALEYGLPPTGGWGMGIDRLVMLLTGHAHIRDVLAFPMLRSKKFE